MNREEFCVRLRDVGVVEIVVVVAASAVVNLLYTG